MQLINVHISLGGQIPFSKALGWLCADSLLAEGRLEPVGGKMVELVAGVQMFLLFPREQI